MDSRCKKFEIKNNHVTTTTLDNPVNPEITFQSGNGTWIMKLEKKDGVNRILFNREDNPDMLPDDFAKAVVKILEEAFPVMNLTL